MQHDMHTGDRAEILVRHNRARARPKEIFVAGSYADEAPAATVEAGVAGGS
jgi:hypothetical protein